jgi:hypothetical protein
MERGGDGCGHASIRVARQTKTIHNIASPIRKFFIHAAGAHMMNSYNGVGRNDPCPCGSGKKFEKCCLGSQGSNQSPSGLHQVDLPAPEGTRSAPAEADGAIRKYDPLTEPSSQQWLALDEQERIDLVLEYHRRARIRLPREQLHAVLHVAVENQVADAALPVRQKLQRLMSEGLDRHEAVHAIGTVLTGHLNALMREIKSGGDSVTKSGRDANEIYFARLEALTAEGWLRSGR